MNSAFIEGLDEFYRDLGFRLELFAEVQKRLDVHLASRFNVFEYINPNENRITQIIANLLDPEGKHGQGMLFLNIFLETIEHPELRDPSVRPRVRCEESASVPGKSGRLDCTIEIDGFRIGIENKPSAIEQTEQLRRYAQSLRQKNGEQFCLVLLDGRQASLKSLGELDREELEGKRQFKMLTYQRDLKDFLQKCRKECNAEKVRWFLHDFEAYVERWFPSTSLE